MDKKKPCDAKNERRRALLVRLKRREEIVVSNQTFDLCDIFFKKAEANIRFPVLNLLFGNSVELSEFSDVELELVEMPVDPADAQGCSVLRFELNTGVSKCLNKLVVRDLRLALCVILPNVGRQRFPDFKLLLVGFSIFVVKHGVSSSAPSVVGDKHYLL